MKEDTVVRKKESAEAENNRWLTLDCDSATARAVSAATELRQVRRARVMRPAG